MEGRVLFITSRLNSDKSGGYLVSRRNYDHIIQIFKDKVDVFKINLNIISRIINIVLFSRLELSSPLIEREILNEIKNKNYKIIFIDNSGLGFFCEKIRKLYPDIKIVVFCHDINFQLFTSILEEYKKDKRSLKKYLKIIKLIFEKRNALKNELRSFKCADAVITLNRRDSILLKEIYGRSSDAEIGITLKEKSIKVSSSKLERENLKLLFVGTASLKANVTGIEKFIKKVFTKLEKCELVIVGKGFEKYKKELENKKLNISVIGTVEDIRMYYLESDLIIAPIYAGGGMKVKTAEALSYGKTIFGTKEAFEGYEIQYDKIGAICNTEEEFILKIKEYIKWWEKNGKPTFNKCSYNIFKDKYSYEASLRKFKEFFSRLE